MAETYNVQEAMAKIRAAKAAKEATATQPSPPVTQPPAAQTSPPAATVPAPVTALAQPVCPPNCPPEVWATLPPDVQATVALGPQGQAEPVNPPEAAQGLVESATGEPAKPAEPKKRGNKDRKGPEMPPNPSPSDLLLLEELKGIRVGLNNQTVAVCEAIDQQTEAIKALTGAMLEAAAILAAG